jgi:hypothetical protein
VAPLFGAVGLNAQVAVGSLEDREPTLEPETAGCADDEPGQGLHWLTRLPRGEGCLIALRRLHPVCDDSRRKPDQCSDE